MRRGDEVEARFGILRDRAKRAFERLEPAVTREAPDLVARLAEAKPKPVASGYQVLPKLVPDAPRGASQSHVSSVPFSWVRVESAMAADEVRLQELEGKLDAPAPTASSERHAALQELVDDYVAVSKSLRLEDSWIRHNRFWQREIDGHRADYDRATVLHDAVLERQSILESLAPGPLPDAAQLIQRARQLQGRIQERTMRTFPPPFVRLEHPSARQWIVVVSMVTDIEDAAFLDQLRQTVERVWRLRDGDDAFSVLLELRQISPVDLYACDSADCAPPAPGGAIDFAEHIPRFPAGSAVLTTGATLTYTERGSLRLGAADLTFNVLAHELGHVLGFSDGYFRGYRDLGADGYEILEVVADPEDIMSAAGVGKVRRYHFDRLIAALTARSHDGSAQ